LYDVHCEAWVAFEPQANNFKFGCLFNHEKRKTQCCLKQLTRFWEGQMEVNSEWRRAHPTFMWHLKSKLKKTWNRSNHLNVRK
jgi:hypothetical protein